MGVSRRRFSIDSQSGWHGFAAALLFLLGGCTSEPSAPATPLTVTPTNLTVTYLAPNRVLLSWTEPTTRHDGNRLEYAPSGGIFRQIGDLIPLGTNRVIVEWPGELPELIVLSFRLTSMSQGSPIGPPATVQFTEPLRPLSAIATAVGNRIQLNWFTTSTLADRVEVRRAHYREPSTVAVDDPSAAGSYPLSQTVRVDTDIL